MGDGYFEGGSPVAATPRHTARRLLAALEARGLEISWGWEFEFYTFRRDVNGELEPTTPDGQALHQVRHRQVEPMLDALRRWLAPAGIELDDGILLAAGARAFARDLTGAASDHDAFDEVARRGRFH